MPDPWGPRPSLLFRSLSYSLLATSPRSEHIDTLAYERVLSVARSLAQTSDLDEILRMVIDAMRDILHADRASVFQFIAEENVFFATQAHGLPHDMRIPNKTGFIADAARTLEIVNVPDAYADPRFNKDVDKQTGYTTRCLLAIPLLDPDQNLIGVAQVLNKEGGVFTAEDEKVAETLADQAAVALKRAILLEAEIQKNKLERDIAIARRIQLAALPDKLPVVPGYDITAITEPADETGGDAFDVISLDRNIAASDTGTSRHLDHAPRNPAPPGSALVFLGDAAGHGIGPALSVTQVLSMLRMACRLSASLSIIAQQMNEQLCQDLPLGRFVTAFMGILDPVEHQMIYTSAGQAPLIHIPADPEGEVLNLGANGMPFGIDPKALWDRRDPIHFAPGDIFLLLSDGYYEASSPSGDMFGAQRVIASAREAISEPASVILEKLRADLLAHVQHPIKDDDQTAIIIKRNP